MKRSLRKLKRFAISALLGLLVGQLIMPPNVAAELTYDQQQAILKDFSNWHKGFSFGSHVFQELFGNKETARFLDDYAGGVALIQASKELAYSRDLAAAARILKNRLQDKLIKRVSPNFSSWLGWIKWAKTGMELFKDFVFDPMVEESQTTTYNGLRDAGMEPEDAWAGVRGYGYLVERAKKEFRRQYGDLPFQKGTNELLPKWEANFLRFAKAGMEEIYQRKLHREAVAKYKAAAEQAKLELEAMRERLLLLAEKYRVGSIAVTPGSSEIHPGQQVTFSATCVYADQSTDRSAEDVTGRSSWSGGAGGNVFTATEAHAGKTITVTATYGGVSGSATVTVTDNDCGEHGVWNKQTFQCDCDSGYTWNAALMECVSDGDATDEAPEVLAGMERRFYGAVELFDDYYQDFVAGLKASAGRPPEEICKDAKLAFSFARAAAAYDIVESYYFEALDMVDRGDRGLNWFSVAAGNYEEGIHVLDQIRLELFRKDRLRVKEAAEGLPGLLAQYAPGCDPADFLDLGSRTAETDQDGETAGTAGTGGGGGGGGELRFVTVQQPITQSVPSASCSGGRVNLNASVPSFPQTILPSDSYNLPISFNWSASGGDIRDFEVVIVVAVGTEMVFERSYTSFSGSPTANVPIRGSQFDFKQQVETITVTIAAGILCGNGSSGSASYLFNQPYLRAGSN